MRKVSILGTDYPIIIKKYDEDDTFQNRSIDGYCDNLNKEIVLCDMTTYKGWENESKKDAEIQQKYNLRHEIVHAFLNESGLGFSSFQCDVPWAKNEEMIDWIALQGEKIFKAWQEAGAL